MEMHICSLHTQERQPRDSKVSLIYPTSFYFSLVSRMRPCLKNEQTNNSKKEKGSQSCKEENVKMLPVTCPCMILESQGDRVIDAQI